MDEIVVDRLLAAPGRQPAVPGTRIRLDGDRFAAVEVIAAPGNGLLAMPALANAHDHGRGLPSMAFGAVDQPLELWLPALALSPALDMQAQTALALARMARGGIGAAAMFHTVQQPEHLVEEARAVCRAAADVGIRLALIVPLRDRLRLALGEDDAVLSGLSPAEQARVREMWLQPLPSPARQVELVEEIASACASPMVAVQYGPVGPQWCSDALLQGIAEASAHSGRRVHMHLLETERQREWADARYAQGLVRHLDELGLLSPRLTVAHGVWLRREEMALLAERGVTVSINASSNLRLRSGIAPVRDFIATGLRFGFGLDAMSFDDDDDGLRELRLVNRLFNGPGLAETLPPARLFAAAVTDGYRTICGDDSFGEIAPGRPADMVLLDHAAMSRDVVPRAVDDVDLILTRATAAHVHGLVVAGRWVVRDGRVVGVDEAALARAVAAETAAQAEQVTARLPLLRRWQGHLRAFYADGRHRRAG